MNNVENYISGIDSSLEKIRNNYEYYKAFGSFFIASKIREDLEDIIEEMEKVKDFASSLDK
ncbi:MAG: hypothetical protein IKQ35_03050 [Bacilli bacterium]|nr:hypothetical protein [Bacilli bacterium]